MKTCPVCHAVTFDDASVCFGCLHRFDTVSASADGKAGRHGKSGVRGVVPGGQGVLPALVIDREQSSGPSEPLDVRGACQAPARSTVLGQPGAAFVISVLPRRTAEGAVAWYCDVAAQRPQASQATYA